MRKNQIAYIPQGLLTTLNLDIDSIDQSPRTFNLQAYRVIRRLPDMED